MSYLRSALITGVLALAAAGMSMGPAGAAPWTSAPGAAPVVEPVQFLFFDDEPPPPPVYYYPPPPRAYYPPPPRAYYPPPPRAYYPPPPPPPAYGYGYGYGYGGSRKEAMKDYVKGQRAVQKDMQKNRIRAWNQQNGF